jgi:hypothetical protein
MTVAELIAKLQTFPADMRVMVSGFDEAGYDDVGTVEIIKDIVDTGFIGHAGRYDELDQVDEAERRSDPFNAVHINF